MTGAVTVRTATVAEVDEVLDIYEWLFAPPGSVPPGWDRAGARERLLATLDPEETEADVLVGDVGGSLAGLCSVYLDLLSVRFGPRVWIEDLVVDPNRRSEGIGEALMDAAARWARERGATHYELDSGERRVDAHRFYERLQPSWAGRHYSWWIGDHG